MFALLVDICDEDSHNNSLLLTDGTLTSPNYPSTYPNNLNCYVDIRISGGSVVNITIDDINVEKSNYGSTCYDKLLVCIIRQIK